MYLYVIFAANGLFKIGKAANALNRAAQIKTSSPVECSLITAIEYDSSAFDLEDYFHSKFNHRRVRGEWFALQRDDLLEILAGTDDETISIINSMDVLFEMGRNEQARWPAHPLARRAAANSGGKRDEPVSDGQ
jgi:hypothetical protein